jgi:hypothetical protein
MTMQPAATQCAADARVYRPGPMLSPATFSGHPGRPATPFPSTDRSWKDPAMPTSKPKPEPAEDEREQARRALQTSMDTRQ